MMNGDGTGGGGWIVMLVVLAALIGLVVFTMTRLLGGGHGVTDDGGAVEAGSTARDMLDRRLARGEIDAETHSAIADRLAHGSGR
jgi:putative membrane protein